MSEIKTYVWCTYREWSFRVLEAIQDLENWKTGLIITTDNCIYDLSKFEKRGIEILRVNPLNARKEFEKGGKTYEKIIQVSPETIISPGWSWYIPEDILNYRICVTYHLGKLPQDRGGSPIQNQIRNGEKWTYLNVMKQEKGLDEGPVFMKEKISLEGDAEDVWERMVSAGVILSRKFLKDLYTNTIKAQEQENTEAKIYKRIKAEDAELKPEKQSAVEMLNIVRAHYEKDPNTYVIPAYINIDEYRKLEIFKASLKNTESRKVFSLKTVINDKDNIYWIINKVNNQEYLIKIDDYNSKSLYLKQINLRLR